MIRCAADLWFSLIVSRPRLKPLVFLVLILMSSAACHWAGTAGRSVGDSPVQQRAGVAPEGFSCPVQETMCPMVFEPVRCTLLLGEAVLGTVDAENSCVGQLKLRSTWCELKAKEDPSGGVAKGIRAPTPSIKCSPQV